MSLKMLRDTSSLIRHAIAVAVSLLVIMTFIYIDTRKELALNDQKLQAIIEGIADSIDRQLAAWRISLDAMSVSSDLSQPNKILEFSKAARRFADLTGTNVAFFRAENEGITLLSHTQVPDAQLPKFYPEPNIETFFQTIKAVEETGQNRVTDFFVGPIAGELIASLVISKSNTLSSKELMSLNFTSSHLSHMLDQIPLPKDYVIGLVDQNGVIGARSENYKDFVGKVIPADTLKIYQSADSGVVTGDSVRGAKHDSYRIQFKRLKEAKGWTVSLLVPASAYPMVTIGPLSLAVGIFTFLLTNGVAWGFGAARRQRRQIEDAHRLSTRRLLDELPGAILRGRFTKDREFVVGLAFGNLATTLVEGTRFRFEDQLKDHLFQNEKSVSGRRAGEFDVSENGRDFRLLVGVSQPDHDGDAEYNIYGFDISNLRAAEAAAISSARLAALGQMSATLAHEMSQPINVITMAADNAEGSIVDQDLVTARSKVQKIRDVALKSRKLIDNLLVYSRGDAEGQSPVPVDLCRSVELAQELTQPLWRKANIQIVLKPHPGARFVLARPVELENIFVNLIMNSVDAFQLRPDMNDPQIIIDIAVERSFSIIRFSDNAGGISRDILQAIFEPFVTTKPVGHGTGLGLAFVLGHVRAWGGDITAKNTALGAEFEIRLLSAKAIN